jgi:hypothetical protein
VTPTALYYYRELQSLRDPLHFPARLNVGTFPRRGAKRIGGEEQKSSRKSAIRP